MSNQKEFQSRASPEERGTIRFYLMQFILLLPLIIVLANSRVLPDIIPTDEPPITPTDEIFEVHIFGIPTHPLNGFEIDDWSFNISGLVDSPISLNYSEILAMPQTSINSSLICVVGDEATALWTGVTLEYLFNLVGFQDSATDVIFTALDGYNSSFNLDEIETSEIILATHVNGDVLPPEIGYPFRIVAPGHYGYKWVQFLSEMILVDYDHIGYWENRGWLDDARIPEDPLPKIWSDWSVHAIGLSITFYFGALTWIGGAKRYLRKKNFLVFPKFFTRKLHLALGIIYGILTFVLAGGWIINTIQIKGNLAWSVHGILAVISMGAMAGILPTSILKWRKNKYRPKIPWHLVFTTISVLAMIGAGLAGLFLIK